MNPYIQFLQTEIPAYFSSRDRKSARQQWREMHALWTKYQCIPYHYLRHRLYEHAARPDFIEYLPAKLIQHFRRDRNPQSHLRMLNDKRETVRALAGTGARCVETLCSVSEDGTILGGDGAAITADTAARELRARGGVLFVKPINSRGGHGAFKIEAAKIDTKTLRSIRNVIIQPALRNHPVIDALNATALNIVRVGTFVDGGRCTTIAALISVAQGNAVVSNGCLGAVSVGVDLTSGVLNPIGMTAKEHGRRAFTVHPGTGVRFDSVTLPFWQETLELAKRAALGLQPHVTLGLDIAITPDGPVFIEANHAGDIVFLQDACGPLGASPLGQSVLAHWLRARKGRRHVGGTDTSGAKPVT